MPSSPASSSTLPTLGATPARSNATSTSGGKNQDSFRNDDSSSRGVTSSGLNTTTSTPAASSMPSSTSVLSGAAGVASPSSVLRQLSFEAMSSSSITSPLARRTRSSYSHRKQQGVLWKRRDVFKNRWRPRWFVLHPHQGVLTYYLLTNENDHTVRDGNSVRDNLVETNHNNDTPGGGSNRRRTWSESSNVSENSVDYDVVPRGTIYLLGGCSVEANDALTRPEDNLYAFTIISPMGVA